MARIPTQDNFRSVRIEPTRGPYRSPGRTDAGRDSSGGAPQTTATAGSGRAPRDPFDLGGAIDRLRTLIAFDAGAGPREGVPARGFYLNILV